MSEEIFLIAKAERAYRASALQAINPRSKTDVREGSMGRRAARRGGGAFGGSLAAGTAAGLAGRAFKVSPARAAQLSGFGSSIGAAVGSSVGRTYNVKSGDVRATNRRTGKQARGAVTVPKLGAYWKY